jgi:glucose/mannose-6-phosphate isomerase
MTTRPDALGLADALRLVPERTEQAMLAVQDAPLPSAEDAVAIAVVGNGAAGFAAQVVSTMAAATCAAPVAAVVDGELPAWVGSRSLVVVIDHGEAGARTARAVREAAALGAALVATAVPGEVARAVAELGGTAIELAASAPVARMALGALCAAPLVVLDRLGFLPGLEPALDHAVRQLHLRREQLDSPTGDARVLARRIGRSIPLVTGGGPVGRLAAQRWKAQCNTNAKIPAFASALPELAFDEVSGWGQHGDVTRQVLTSVLLRHAYERPDVRGAFERLVPILEESVLGVHQVEAQGEGPLAQLLDLAYLGDAVSLELAAQEGLDPGPAPGLTMLDG